jgi:hypothetical protein
MDGGREPQLVCLGFIESETFKKSRHRLKQWLVLTDRDIDERLEGLIWGLPRDSEGLLARKVGKRNLWVAVTDHPHLRVYMRPRVDVPDECELLWIEETPVRTTA